MSAQDLLAGKSPVKIKSKVRMSPDEVKLLRQDIYSMVVEQGKSKRHVAKYLGLSERAVYRHLDAFNLERLEKWQDTLLQCIEHEPEIASLIEKTKNELGI